MIGPHLDGEPYLSLGKFIAGWLPALAITSQIDPAPQLADALVLPIGGVPVPVVTCLLGLLGVLLARPLARKREARVGWTGWALVTAIMLVVVLLWIVEARPSALFAFVLASDDPAASARVRTAPGRRLRRPITSSPITCPPRPATRC